MNESLPRRLAHSFLKLANWLVDGVVLVVLVLIVCFTVFTVVDNNRVLHQADTAALEPYQPTGDGKSFGELQARNPDVLGWLTIYGTGINYPVVQGDDNETYINTDAAGNFALSGALFLDYRNARDFSGASTIIFGHHMENGLMFGDLDRYADADYLNAHDTGNLFYGGADHGVEILGYLATDSHDRMVYSTTVGKDPTAKEFTDYLRTHATVWRRDPDKGDHLLLFSTCGKGTNNRHIVVARICDQTFENPYADDRVNRILAGTVEGPRAAAIIGIGLLVGLLIAWKVRRGSKVRSSKVSSSKARSSRNRAQEDDESDVWRRP